MKIIGITGMSGAGKSTFTEMLGENEKVGIIKVDDFVGKAKKKYFKRFLQPEENNTTEPTRENPKLNNSVKKFFFQNKILFLALMKLRSVLVRQGVEAKIEEYKRNGKELIVIDDWMITTHKWLLKRKPKIYTIKRKFLDRRQGLKVRSDLTQDELKVYDLPYVKKFVREPNNFDIVQNNGTFEQLREYAQLVYERYVPPTFDERYGVNETDLGLIGKFEKQYSRDEKSRDEIV